MKPKTGCHAHHRRRGQNGAALIVSLLILVVLTLLGLTAMGTATLEEKMSGNQRDHDVAFEAAEGALAQGKLDIERVFDNPFMFGSGSVGGSTETAIQRAGLYNAVLGSTSPWQGSWETGNSVGSPAVSGLPDPPAYMAEFLGEIALDGYDSSIDLHPAALQVTARARGHQPGTEVLVQMDYISIY